MPPKFNAHTSPEVLTSVELPTGYEPGLEAAGGVRYHDPDVTGTGELSIRRYLSGLPHMPSPQVAAHLHLHSGNGARNWTGESRPFEIDGAPATLRPFSDISQRLDGAVIVSELGETLMSIRALWQAGLRTQRDQLLEMAARIRLLASEDLAVPRRSQLHPMYSISVERPQGWRLTQMEDDIWEFVSDTGTCALRELDTHVDMGAINQSEIAALMDELIPVGASREDLEQRPTATAAPLWSCQWTSGGEHGVAGVLARAIPLLINARTRDPQELPSLLALVDSVRSHPALH